MLPPPAAKPGALRMNEANKDRDVAIQFLTTRQWPKSQRAIPLMKWHGLGFGSSPKPSGI